MERQGNKLRFSRFAHFVTLEGGYTAIYNSLNMGIVFAKTEVLDELQRDEWAIRVDSKLIETLEKEKLVAREYDELADYRKIQELLSELPISVLYLLLTEQCNFACRYCFIEGGLPATYKPSWMTPEVADAGINLFVKTLARNTHRHVHPRVIFYGGEPLLNFKTLQFALECFARLREKGTLPENLELTMNTNASAVTKTIAKTLAKHQVAISVSLDGTREIHNKGRVFSSGVGTFNATVRGFRLLQEEGVPVSISCTISEASVGHLEEIFNFFLEEFGVKAIGFNLIREGVTPKLKDAEAYMKTASEALISCFKIGRERGIYEDRMMRKVRAFVKRQPHLNDCAGCGQQIVVAPTGEVGICHADVGRKAYFVANTPDFDPITHPYWVEWRRRSPFSMPECLDCIALGICGGGCSYQTYLDKGTIWSVDELFCIHSKLSLEFLIKDLWEQTRDAKTE